MVDVYADNTLLRTLSYKSREWLTITVSFTEPSSYKVMIDNQVAAEGTIVNTAASGLATLRLGTADGPGYHLSVPVVFYVDSFTVKSGLLLSDNSQALSTKFPGLITVQQGNIHITNMDPSIQQIRVFSVDGRQLFNQHFSNENPGDLMIRITGKDNMLLVMIVDSQGRAFTRKIIRY